MKTLPHKAIVGVLVALLVIATGPSTAIAGPVCEVGDIALGPPIIVSFTVQAPINGLKGITVLNSLNASINIPPFAPGIVSVIYVTATQRVVGEDFMVVIEAEDMTGATSTCGYNEAPADSEPPEAVLLSQDPGPPFTILVEFQDLGSGLEAVTVLQSTNAVVNIPAFNPGTTNQVLVSVTRTDPNANFGVELEARDLAGNTRSFQYNLNEEDDQAPTCSVTDEDPGPPFTVKLSIQDVQSGLQSISIADALNADITIPNFPPGITSPSVTVTAERVLESTNFSFTLELEDMAGNSSTCGYNLQIEDLDPPTCRLVSLFPGPPAYMEIALQDVNSGMQTISLVNATNATVEIPAFAQGAQGEIIVQATQILSDLDYSVLLEAQDMEGNVISCRHPLALPIVSAPEMDAVNDDSDGFFYGIFQDRIISTNRDGGGNLINEHSDFTQEQFITDAGLPLLDPCYSMPGDQYLSVLTPPWSQAAYEWDIVLQMHPTSDLELIIVGCALTPGQNDPWSSARQTGAYRLPWKPDELVFVPSANPMVTVKAYPGASAAPGFPAEGFYLDTRTMPGLSATPLVDVPFVTKPFSETSILVVRPATGATNASGQTVHDLRAGDRLRIRIDLPPNNTADVRFGSKNVWLMYLGRVGSEYSTLD